VRGRVTPIRGEGGAVGPNLSHLNNVNPESVLQDIVAPSARITRIT